MVAEAFSLGPGKAPRHRVLPDVPAPMVIIQGFFPWVHPCQGHCDGARAPSRGPQGPVLPQRPWELTQDSECSGVAEGERGRDQQGDAVEFIFTKNLPKPHRTGTEIKEKSHPQPPHPRKSPDTFFPFPWVSVGRHDFIPF